MLASAVRKGNCFMIGLREVVESKSFEHASAAVTSLDHPLRRLLLILLQGWLLDQLHHLLHPLLHRAAHQQRLHALFSQALQCPLVLL